MEEADLSDLTAVDIHEVLSNERRRLLLGRLRTAGGTMSARDLSEYIAEQESGESPPPRNIRQSAYVSLHQTHLPKLDELGIIEYNESEKTVTLDEAASRELEAYMRTDPENGPSWIEYHLGLSVLGLLLLAATRFDVPVATSIPDVVWMGTILALIAVSAAYRIVTQDGSILYRLATGESGAMEEEGGEKSVE